YTLLVATAISRSSLLPVRSSLSRLHSVPRPPRPTLFPYTTLFRSPHAPIGRFRCRSRWPPGPLCRGRRSRSCRSGRGRAERPSRSEEHTSELQSREKLVCRLLLEKKKQNNREHKRAARTRVWNPGP